MRFVCERAGRLVSQREVELLLRITPRAAQSALVTMLATYEEALRDKFLARFRADAVVIPSGTTDSGLTWTLRFTESTTLDAAWSELTRLGLLAESELNVAQKKVTVPRLVEVAAHHNGRRDGGRAPRRPRVARPRQTRARVSRVNCLTEPSGSAWSP